jgi:hypothetical protein
MPPRNSERVVRMMHERILAILGTTPQGITSTELRIRYQAAHGEAMTERTARRYLAALIKDTQVQTEGRARATRYRPRLRAVVPPVVVSLVVPLVAPSTPTPQVGTATPPAIPLSAEGAEVRELVRQTAVLRNPVGYDQSMLRQYIPGQTWYLPATTREALGRRGRTPVAGQPAGTYAREIYEELLIDLSWSSTRLEGSSITRIDTKETLAQGRGMAGLNDIDKTMVWNHKEAIDLLVDDAEDVGFNRATFLSLHGALSRGLLGDARDEGRLRQRGVRIDGSPYKPLEIPQLIDELFNLFLEKGAAIPDPFEQSFFVMVHVPYLQPFADVNKRTSRLGANLPLIRANLCPLSFLDVPLDLYGEAMLGVYEYQRVDLLRDVFVWAYNRSCDQYVVLREAKPTPDPIRMKYREHLAGLVRDIVRRAQVPSDETLWQLLSEAGVPSEDRDAVLVLLQSALADIHEGVLRRYQLRPSEMRTWHALVGAPRGERV